MAEKKKQPAVRRAAKKPKAVKAKVARPKPAKTSKAKAAPTKAKTPAAKTRSAAKSKPAQPRANRDNSPGFDIAKILDHPLVADLLAVGAIAAVAAIADHSVRTRTGESEAGSSKAVKAAGKAAAAAIGKRLMTEVEAIREVSNAKGTKPGAK